MKDESTNTDFEEQFITRMNSWRDDAQLWHAVATMGQPLVACYRGKNGRGLNFRCPWCGHVHHHEGGENFGAGDGHRVAHCDHWAGGYVLVETPRLDPLGNDDHPMWWMRRQMLVWLRGYGRGVAVGTIAEALEVAAAMPKKEHDPIILFVDDTSNKVQQAVALQHLSGESAFYAECAKATRIVVVPDVLIGKD